MRPIRRLPLSESTTVFLQIHRTNRVRDAANPTAEAEHLWKGGYLRCIALRNVRHTLHNMASARSRCMYCEDNAGTDIDHFWPKAHYPQRAFEWENLLLACSFCNRNKADRFPLDDAGQALLLDPTNPDDDPREHLDFLPSDGRYVARNNSRRGQVSIEFYGLNDDNTPRRLPTGRRDVVHKVRLMLSEFEEHCRAGRTEAAETTRLMLLREPFQGVLVHIASAVARNAQGAARVYGEWVNVVRERRVHQWLDLP